LNNSNNPGGVENVFNDCKEGVRDMRPVGDPLLSLLVLMCCQRFGLDKYQFYKKD